MNTNEYSNADNSAWRGKKSEKILGPKELVDIFLRHKLLLASLFTVIFATAVIVTFLIPKSYVSSAKLLIKKGRADTIISAGNESNAAVKTNITEQVLNSETEIITSSALLRAVVKATDLHLLQPSDNVVVDSTILIERTVAALRGALSVNPIQKSNVIQVSYEHGDPKTTALVVNQLCKLYVDRHLEIHENRGVFSFYKKQVDFLGDSLDVLKKRLRQFESENGIFDPENQSKLLIQQKTDFERELQTTQANAAEVQEKVVFLTRQIRNEPGRMQRQSADARNSVKLKMEADLDSLKTIYMSSEMKKASNAKRRSMRQEIATLEESLLQAKQATPQERADDISGSVSSITQEMVTARAALRGLKGKEKSIQTSIQELAARIDSLEGSAMLHTQWNNDLEIIQENFANYSQKMEEARIAEALDKDRVANVTIIDEAEIPLAPARPNVKLNIALGFILAVTLSFGITFSVGYFDKTIRTIDDLQRECNVPVLATISENHWMGSMLHIHKFETYGNKGDLVLELWPAGNSNGQKKLPEGEILMEEEQSE